eukprot:gene28494-33669_t
MGRAASRVRVPPNTTPAPAAPPPPRCCLRPRRHQFLRMLSLPKAVLQRFERLSPWCEAAKQLCLSAERNARAAQKALRIRDPAAAAPDAAEHGDDAEVEEKGGGTAKGARGKATGAAEGSGASRKLLSPSERALLLGPAAAGGRLPVSPPIRFQHAKSGPLLAPPKRKGAGVTQSTTRPPCAADGGARRKAARGAGKPAARRPDASRGAAATIELSVISPSASPSASLQLAP